MNLELSADRERFPDSDLSRSFGDLVFSLEFDLLIFLGVFPSSFDLFSFSSLFLLLLRDRDGDRLCDFVRLDQDRRFERLRDRDRDQPDEEDGDFDFLKVEASFLDLLDL